MNYRSVDPEIEEVVIAKLNGKHTWMLTEEFVPVVLASSLIPDSNKAAIAEKILSFKDQKLSDLPLGKPELPIIHVDTALEDLIDVS